MTAAEDLSKLIRKAQKLSNDKAMESKAAVMFHEEDDWYFSMLEQGLVEWLKVI